MRDAFSNALVRLALADPKFCCLLAIMAMRCWTNSANAVPISTSNAGIAEHHMVGILAGLARVGTCPFVYALVAFVPIRTVEQIKLDIAHDDLPVVLLGDSACFVYRHLGTSHQSTEDIAVTRPIPGLEVLSPSGRFEMTANWRVDDVRDSAIDDEHFDVIRCVATDVVAQTSQFDVFSTCLNGTRPVLALARACGASRLLLLTSGAVYGPLPAGMTHVPESYLGRPDPLSAESAYGQGKRASEWLAAQAAADGLTVGIARLIAVVGPHLPLDKHFVIENFLRAALAGEKILIQGNGKPQRSYLRAADMAAWLWAVLLRGRPGRAYNVGADASLSITQPRLSQCLALGSEPRLRVLQPTPSDAPTSHYVPDVARARAELGLAPLLSLDEAISRTARWHAGRAATRTHAL